MNIYEKLQSCRVELQNMNLKKSGENKFAKFTYYELSDFLPAVNSLFQKHKLFSNFSIINDFASLVIYDTEADGHGPTIEFSSPAASADVKGCTPIQSLGAQHTYLKRYLYLNALEIVENDSLDGRVGQAEFVPKPNPDDEIYLGIESLQDFDSLQKFYEEYKTKVADKAAFNKAINQRNKKIKELLSENI